MDEDILQQKSKKGPIIAISIILVLVLLLAGFIAALKLDIGSLGTSVIGPKIQNIPGASLILPTMPDETATGDGEAEYESIDQVVEILKVTEDSLKEKEEEAEKLSEQIDQLESENERLSVFEDNYSDFETEKEAFDQEIVDQTDPEAFATWYEEMNPDNAADIYASVIQSQAETEELDSLIAKYQEMKPAAAAAILEEMGATRLAMVSEIISNLDDEQAAKVLAAMDTQMAARITTYLYPEQ